MTMLFSYWFRGENTLEQINIEEFINQLKSKNKQLMTISKGRSLKLCMVSEGSADIYPGLAATMECDTTAADAVVRGVGK